MIHVTSIRNGSVYGHDEALCDPAGCSGGEHYFSALNASEVTVGDLVADPAAISLGKRGGQAKSEAKSAAARENGKRGGRPAKKPEVE